MNDDKEFGFCMYCGSKILLERNDKITIDKTKDLKNYLSLAKDEMETGGWDKAAEYIEKASEIESCVADVWYAKALIARNNDDEIGYTHNLNKISEDMKNVGIIDQNVIDEIWECSVVVEFVKTSSFAMSELSVKVDNKATYIIKNGSKRTIGLKKGNHKLYVFGKYDRNANSNLSSENTIMLNIDSDCYIEIKIGFRGFKITKKMTLN